MSSSETQPKINIDHTFPHVQCSCSKLCNVFDEAFLFGVSILLAHLSRRLTGELIGYVGLRRPSSTVLNIFSSGTAWPIKVKFHMEPAWDGGTKIYSNGPGHMTKMAAMPIYGKNLKQSSPEPKCR